MVGATVTGKQYFQGQELPPLREGHVWGFKMWPGGRKEVQQVRPDRIQSLEQGAASVRRGDIALVSLNNALPIARLWTMLHQEAPA